MDFVVLLVAAGAVSIVAAAFVAGRVMRSDDRDGIVTVTLRGWRQPDWPRGVQEEEPVHLHLDGPMAAPRTVADCPDSTPLPHVNRRSGFPVRVA